MIGNRGCWLITAALAFTLPAPARAADDRALSQRLAAIAGAQSGVTGVAVVHLEDGRTASYNGNQRFPMQSVYKLPIGIAVLDQIDRGRLKLGDEVVIRAADVSPGPDPKRWEGLPKAVTIGQLLELMLGPSDNTACDKLIELAQGPAAVTRTLARRGVRQLVVSRPERQMTADFCRDTGAPRCGEATHAQKLKALRRQVGRGHDVTTPRAMASLLIALQRGELLSPESTALVLSLMTGSTTGARRLKADLPAGTIVAHRTGTGGDGIVVNDVGLISLPDGKHVAIAVLIKEAAGDIATSEPTIAKLARATYDFFVSPPR